MLKLSGRLDVPGSQAALGGLMPAISQGARLVLDMSECGYIASSGLRMLLIAAKQAERLHAKIALAQVQPLVDEVITMTGFSEVLDLYPSVTAAVNALAQ